MLVDPYRNTVEYCFTFIALFYLLPLVFEMSFNTPVYLLSVQKKHFIIQNSCKEFLVNPWTYWTPNSRLTFTSPRPYQPTSPRKVCQHLRWELAGLCFSRSPRLSESTLEYRKHFFCARLNLCVLLVIYLYTNRLSTFSYTIFLQIFMIQS